MVVTRSMALAEGLKLTSPLSLCTVRKRKICAITPPHENPSAFRPKRRRTRQIAQLVPLTPIVYQNAVVVTMSDACPPQSSLVSQACKYILREQKTRKAVYGSIIASKYRRGETPERYRKACKGRDLQIHQAYLDAQWQSDSDTEQAAPLPIPYSCGRLTELRAKNTTSRRSCRIEAMR